MNSNVHSHKIVKSGTIVKFTRGKPSWVAEMACCVPLQCHQLQCSDWQTKKVKYKDVFHSATNNTECFKTVIGYVTKKLWTSLVYSFYCLCGETKLIKPDDSSVQPQIFSRSRLQSWMLFQCLCRGFETSVSQIMASTLIHSMGMSSMRVNKTQISDSESFRTAV